MDFGNNETVSRDRLRKDVVLAEVPQQCLKLHVVGISPVSHSHCHKAYSCLFYGSVPDSAEVALCRPMALHLFWLWTSRG